MVPVRGGDTTEVNVVAERNVPCVHREDGFASGSVGRLHGDAAIEAPGAQERRIQGEALRAFQLVGCSGWGRVDVMVDRDGEPYLLEVNTMPGMTDHSLVPMAARAHGIEFDELCIRILESAHVG